MMLTKLTKMFSKGFGKVQTTRVSINGRSVVIPQILAHGSKNTEVHEDFLDAYLYRLLATTSGAFIDVGANIGQILLKVATKDPNRRYIGFEPSTFCAFYVEQLIDLNKFGNCDVFAFAVSDRTAVLSLHYSDSADEQATTLPDFWTAKNVRAKIKKIVSLKADEAIKMVTDEKIGILKIDVEGAELEVIRGCENTIRTHTPAILIEILPYLVDTAIVVEADRPVMAKRRARIEELMGLIDGYGYECWRIERSGGLAKAADFGVTEYRADHSNYVLLPKTSSLNLQQS